MGRPVEALDAAAHRRAMGRVWRSLAEEWGPDYPIERGFRAIVRDDVYRRTVAYLELLPKSVDRGSYFESLVVAKLLGLVAVELLTPAWCRRRDEALANLRAAIDQLKGVIRDWDVYPEHNPSEVLTRGLEREFCRLTEPLNGQPSFLTMTPKDGGRSIVGRPVSAAGYARKFLRQAGVPEGKIAGALRAAGLAGC